MYIILTNKRAKSKNKGEHKHYYTHTNTTYVLMIKEYKLSKSFIICINVRM